MPVNERLVMRWNYIIRRVALFLVVVWAAT